MNRKLSLKAVLPLLFLSSALTLIPAAEAQTPAREIASTARQAVVTVRAYSGNEEIALGSGFLVTPNGIFVTNIHVIAGADSLSVELENGEIFDNIYGLALDERRDLAILQLPASNMKFLEIADDRKSEVGDTVYVVGNPLGFSGTFSDGLLSAKRLENGVTYLQISAPISHGSSGGPVLNSEGKVIGVSTLTMAEGQNLNLAVPARHVTGLISLAANPVPFDQYVAALPQQQEMSPSDRAAETVGLMSGLPLETQKELNEMPPFARQIAVRLISYGIVFAEKDFELLSERKSGVLSTDGVDAIKVNLQIGSYVALALCDDDCTDLDVYVMGPNEEKIASDTDYSADAMVVFDATVPGEYLIGAGMISCSTNDCAYSINLFKKN